MKTGTFLLLTLFLLFVSIPPSLGKPKRTARSTFDCFGVRCPKNQVCEVYHAGRKELGRSRACHPFPEECAARDCSCFPERPHVRCEKSRDGGHRLTFSAP